LPKVARIILVTYWPESNKFLYMNARFWRKDQQQFSFLSSV